MFFLILDLKDMPSYLEPSYLVGFDIYVWSDKNLGSRRYRLACLMVICHSHNAYRVRVGQEH